MGASSDRVRWAMALVRIGLGCVGARFRDRKNTGSLGPRLLKASRRRCGCGMEPTRRRRNQHLMVSNHNGRKASLSQITHRPTGVHWPSCTKQTQSNRSTSNSVITRAQASSTRGSPNKVLSRIFSNNQSNEASVATINGRPNRRTIIAKRATHSQGILQFRVRPSHANFPSPAGAGSTGNIGSDLLLTLTTAFHDLAASQKTLFIFQLAALRTKPPKRK